eukprot:XP_020399712.2 trafficking protein particle complex subunit 11-like [Zea mays]
MRRDAVPPPTAPSASSSSSSLFSGGEQLFESGPSTLVFLPLLLIQGGSMDLSRVGEKLLSSVRSVRSLGLLPPTPAAPLPVLRFQNELRRQQLLHGAIAGLPPHERINLPSNSEDLEFDPIKYILQSIPDEGSDATYFDEQEDNWSNTPLIQGQLDCRRGKVGTLVAIYAEFRRDWPEALKFYEEGVRVLREMIGTSTRLPPTQRLVEIKAVAEQFHFKISTLLLHAGKVVEVITWFRKHIKSYERVLGTPEVAFLHWEWFSRQFLVFGELIETTSTTIPDTLSPRFGTADNTLTEWEFQPAYYYQLAATYLREKRYAIECSSSMANLTTEVNGVPESVMPSVYVGQYVRLFEQGDTVSLLPLSDTEYTSYALSEAERFQDSYEIIALFRKAYESFQSLGATRMASACSSGMAIEYYATGDFSNTKQLFDSVAGLYRQEGWTSLLWENLGYLRECSMKLNSPKDFISYSLEMAALPLFSGSGEENRENKIKSGPAGSPCVLKPITIFRLT